MPFPRSGSQGQHSMSGGSSPSPNTSETGSEACAGWGAAAEVTCLLGTCAPASSGSSSLGGGGVCVCPVGVANDTSFFFFPDSCSMPEHLLLGFCILFASIMAALAVFAAVESRRMRGIPGKLLALVALGQGLSSAYFATRAADASSPHSTASLVLLVLALRVTDLFGTGAAYSVALPLQHLARATMPTSILAKDPSALHRAWLAYEVVLTVAYFVVVVLLGSAVSDMGVSENPVTVGRFNQLMSVLMLLVVVNNTINAAMIVILARKLLIDSRPLTESVVTSTNKRKDTQLRGFLQRLAVLKRVISLHGTFTLCTGLTPLVVFWSLGAFPMYYILYCGLGFMLLLSGVAVTLYARMPSTRESLARVRLLGATTPAMLANGAGPTPPGSGSGSSKVKVSDGIGDE